MFTILINFLIVLLTCTVTSNLQRGKRFVEYPKGSAVGYIIALAIPNDDISESVYLAFNFEANYILPNYEDGISSYAYAPKDDIRKRSEDNGDSMEIMDAYSSIKKSFNRRNIYASIESPLFSVGLNGTACILKTICETNEIPIYESNGVFGSLFHILFTPSSSEDENLPSHVYEAEGNCFKKISATFMIQTVREVFWGIQLCREFTRKIKLKW